MIFHVTLSKKIIFFITTSNMYQVRNVSQRFIRNLFRVKPTIESANSSASRQFSLLLKTNSQPNQHKLNQSLLPQIPTVYLRCSFYSTDPPNDDAPPREGRMLPKLVKDKIIVSPPFFSFFTFTFRALKIRNTLDADFSLDDFIEGSKKAVEVIDLFLLHKILH